VTVKLAFAMTLVVRMVRDVTMDLSALRTTSATKERVQVMKLSAQTYALKIRLATVVWKVLLQETTAIIFAVLRIPLAAGPTGSSTIPVSVGLAIILVFYDAMMDPNLF